MLHLSFFFPISSCFFIGSFLFHTYPLLAGQVKITLWLLSLALVAPSRHGRPCQDPACLPALCILFIFVLTPLAIYTLELTITVHNISFYLITLSLTLHSFPDPQVSLWGPLPSH